MANSVWRSASSVIATIWAGIKELGFGGTVGAAIAAGAYAVWGYIAKRPAHALVRDAILIFCAIVVAAACIRLFWREWRLAPRYEVWDSVEPLHLWQAACLWAGVEPHVPIEPTSRAYAHLHMLKAAVSTGQLAATVQPGAKGAVFWSQVKRADLKQLADAKTLPKPPFLYPEVR